MNEYKNYMTVALSSIDQYKRQSIEQNSETLDLQKKLERIIFNYTVPYLGDHDLEKAIPTHKREQVFLNLSKINFNKKEEATKKQPEPVEQQREEAPATGGIIELDSDEKHSQKETVTIEDDDCSIFMPQQTQTTQADSTLTGGTLNGGTLSGGLSSTFIYPSSPWNQTKSWGQDSQPTVEPDTEFTKEMKKLERNKLNKKAQSQILRAHINPQKLDPTKLKVAMRKAFGQIQVRPLIQRIQILQNMWGGVVGAYDMEWKIRQFVIEVINYALVQKREHFHQGIGGQAQKLFPNGLKLDGEKGIEQFNQRVCPDLTVQSHDDQHMVYIVEIKNLRTKQGKGIIR